MAPGLIFQAKMVRASDNETIGLRAPGSGLRAPGSGLRAPGSGLRAPWQKIQGLSVSMDLP